RHDDPAAAQRAPGHLERVGADLVAEPSRAGMDHDRDLALTKAELRGGRGVVDFVHGLDLEEVIARAERAELPADALPGPLGYGAGIGATQSAVGLEMREVVRFAVAAGHGPRRSLLHDLTELAGIERDSAVGAHARGNGRVERIHERLETLAEIADG